MDALEAFLAGDRLDDIAIYIDEQYLDSDHPVAENGISVDGGVVLVVPGEKGRGAFEQATNIDPMDFAQTAMGNNGVIDPQLAGGECPADDGTDDDPHRTEFIFAFAEGQNESVGGLYAEGDVIHAYAHCSCGENYSQKWVIGSRS